MKNSAERGLTVLVKVKRIEVVGDRKLRLWFTDGSAGERDFADELARSGPMAKPLLDPVFFGRVFLDRGVPAWPNSYDMAPWALHKDMAREGALRHMQSV